MASRYDGRTDAPAITRRRHVLACARCRARRVKCDRAQPACSNCVKVGALCQPVQQSGSPHASLPSRPGSREPMDPSRLFKLEEEVARLSREVDSRSPSREPSHSPSPIDPAEGRPSVKEGRIVQGRIPMYFSPHSWAAAAEEVIGIESVFAEDLMENIRQDPTDYVNQGALALVDDHLHGILLGIFSHRVDPMIRLLHWPSFLEKCHAFRRGRPFPRQVPANPAYSTPLVGGASYDPAQQASFANPPVVSPQMGSLQRSTPTAASTEYTFAALLHAVYYAAVASIINSPHPPDLGHNVNIVTLWTALRRETSLRLSCSPGGRTARMESMELLQGIILYLSVEMGSADPQMQWMQLGVAVRIAQALGLHRDPSNFGCGAIETETRRRLWTHICIVDTRLAEQLCREPTITPDSYDTALPLSISDQELADIDRQSDSSKRGQENSFQRLQEIELSHEHVSPFSSMTLTLVEAEVARLQQHLLCFRYHSRDGGLFRASSGSPQLAKKSTPFIGRSHRAPGATHLRHRFQFRYNYDQLDGSDPLQYLTSEICNIHLMKAKLIGAFAQRRETTDHNSIPVGDPDVMSMFHDALQLATRCAALSHQYSGSAYSWYMKRIREPFSCSFLAVLLASDQRISQEDANSAWAVLDQLFTTDSSGHLVELELQDSPLGKVLAKARMKRAIQMQTPMTHQIRSQAMHAAAGVYPTNMSQPSVTSSANLEHPSTFQSSGNLFEDWDALMQEPVWPSCPTTESNYWSSHLPTSSLRHAPSRPLSQPPEQQQARVPPTLILNSQTQTSSPLGISFALHESPLPHSHGTAANVIGTATGLLPSPSSFDFAQSYSRIGTDVSLHTGQPARSRTWSSENHLGVPRGHTRERSLSQPPSPIQSKDLGSQLKRRSASYLDSRSDTYN